MQYDDYREPFARRVPIRPRKAGPIIAWDVETDRIPRNADDPMSVGLRYLTVYGEGINISERTDDRLLASRFENLLDAVRPKSRFVAWNANRFDTLFLLRSLVQYCPQYIVKPMVANQAGLRGARVSRRDNPKIYWDFCDGIAMTGIQQTLAQFTEKFSPDRSKLHGAIDFEKEEFDADNPAHVAYAERDAEALYLAMVEVERIMIRLTGRQLQMTIGGAGIRYFEANIPEGVAIRAVPDELWDLLFDYGMRGGYVYVKQQYNGPVWQYDLNQAYAAAMRDELLPEGNAIAVQEEAFGLPGFYECTISKFPAFNNTVLLQSSGTKLPIETYGEGVNTFISSTEVVVLREHGWRVIVRRGFVWAKSFTMENMVNSLEHLRTSDPGGRTDPSAPWLKVLAAIATEKQQNVLALRQPFLLQENRRKMITFGQGIQHG